MLAYCTTSQLTSGLTPAEIVLLGLKPRTRLDLLQPYTAERVQEQQKATHVVTDLSAFWRRSYLATWHDYEVCCTCFLLFEALRMGVKDAVAQEYVRSRTV